jgi:uncharacterized RDD family membrane protein YckC
MDTDYNQSSQIFTDGPPLEYANFWYRLAASLIDGIILGIPTYFLAFMMGGFDMLGGIDQKYRTFGSVLAFSMGSSIPSIIINWLYFALQESSAAQATLGKRALGIKVIGGNGERISFLNATGRHFGKIVSSIILFIGYLMVLWDSRRQGLHDKMANTFVVKG